MPYKDPAAQREFQRTWRDGRRKAWLADKACVRCGSTNSLELDHVDPAEKVSHKIWSWSAERFAVEVAKCQVLCADCHKLKTFGRVVGAGAEHGTRSRYRSGCKCGPCKAAHLDYKNRVVRAKRGRTVAKEGSPQ